MESTIVKVVVLFLSWPPLNSIIIYIKCLKCFLNLERLLNSGTRSILTIFSKLQSMRFDYS